MIIDGDTHISPQLEWGISVTAEELLAKMDKVGVDKCVTWVHQPYIRSKLDNTVEYIAEVTKKYKGRIHGFGWYDPRLGLENALELAYKSLNEYGLYGVKLNGSLHKFKIDDKEIAYPVLRKIAEAGKIAAFHCGCDDISNTHPYRIGNVAKDFPKMRIFMIHMGGEAYQDASASAVEVAQQYENITLIGSQVPKTSVLNAIKILGAHRVAFGSDTPFALMGAELAGYRGMMDEADIPKEDQDMVLGGTIAKVLGIS